MYGNNLNPTSVNKLYKKGQDALKTSFFALKFKPDYLSAVHYLTEAGKEYKKLKMFKESVKAFEEAIKCNKELLESWAEALNWQELADIYIFELKDFIIGWKCLKSSSLSYKYSGKFTSGIKVYLDFAQKLIENGGRYPQALTVLKEAMEDCFDQTQDELARISMEEAFSKLLDVLCFMENYHEAIETVEKYIKIQRSIKEEKKHKISKNYVKLGMLRIIINELYMAENLQEEMYSCYDSSCADDIEDLQKLIKAFKEVNKKEFSFLITYAFSLYQNNLLKALKKVFDAKTEQQMNENPIREVIADVDVEGVSIENDETKANSEFVGETQSDLGRLDLGESEGTEANEENNVNVNVKNDADDYL